MSSWETLKDFGFVTVICGRQKKSEYLRDKILEQLFLFPCCGMAMQIS